jgi:hypothetical protein
MAERYCKAYRFGMKHKTFYQDKNQKPPDPSPADATEEANLKAKGFMPSTDEEDRRACFTCENEGSKPGRDVQHWLAAEAELTAERNFARVHWFHNQT